MRRLSRFRTVLVLAAMLLSTPGLAQEGQRWILSRNAGGIPTFVRGALGTITPLGPIDPSRRAVQERSFRDAARQYLRAFVVQHMNATGLEELVPSTLVRDRLGLVHLRFDQKVGELTVYGAELIVHVDAETGQVYAVNGEFAPGGGLVAAAAMPSEEAISAAMRDLGVLRYLPIDRPELCYVLAPIRDEAILAWRQLIRFEAEGLFQIDHVFADASTGGLVTRHPTIFTLKRWRTFDAGHGTSLPGTLKCSNGEPCGEPVAQAAHDNTSLTYDYYFQKFGRDSADGQGLELRSSVHYQNNYNNAFWNGTQVVYGDGDGDWFAPLGNALDVVAHELTHGLTQYESGLIYQNESGALNEALSDIFSAGVEAWVDQGVNPSTWMLGEDVFTPGTQGDALRYMNHPTLDGSSYDYYPERYTGSEDNGGVHSNSGIANLAFYLMVEGGVHPRGKTAYQVPMLGLAKAEQIFYRAQTAYLTPSSNFEAARNSTAQAASELYGEPEVAAVHLAWCAVGVPGCQQAPGSEPLENGVPKTGLSGAAGNQKLFTLEVPAGAANLTFQLSGGTGDADLYVRFGSPPSLSVYDCRPYKNGNNETCTFGTPSAGTWHVMIHAYNAYSGASLLATFEEPSDDSRLENGAPKTGLSGPAGDQKLFTLEVPAGATDLTFQLSGGTGDADLYVRFGSPPSLSVYDCRPYKNGNNETCTFDTPSAGTWHVMIHAYQAYSGATLLATFDSSGPGIPSTAVRVNFHARFWNEIAGFEPQSGDYGYILFQPGDSISKITDAQSGEGLGHIPPEHRLLISPSIKGLDQVLSQLGAMGFQLGALGYDLEGWEQTPIEERNNPPAACQKGKALADQYGLPFFVGPTANYSDQWGTRIVPFAAMYQSQDKGRQAQSWQDAVSHQRPLYQQLKNANPQVVLWHDMAIKPKGITKPLSELLDYYYGMFDMTDGIGIWAMGSDEAMLKQFILTVRPPATPPPGDQSPFITSGPGAVPAHPDVGQEVVFTVQASDPDGDALTYSWDFGDHVTWGDGKLLARGNSVTHAYSEPGTYQAKVTVTDARGGAVVSSVDVTVGGGGNDCLASVSEDHWKGEYFSNRTLSGSPSMVRDDGTAGLSFDWGASGPSSACGVGTDQFSARWTRRVSFGPGTYRFTVSVDDGVRLWVGSSLILDEWRDQVATYQKEVTLNGGDEVLKMEYYENLGGAAAQLSWEKIGDLPGPTEPLIIDDGDPGFQLLETPTGKPEWWHPETGVGYGSDMVWTTNTYGRQDNYARWNPTLPAAGQYKVEAHIPSNHATTTKARYQVRANGVSYTRTVNQNIYYDQWVDLGTYNFHAANNGTEFVELGDVTGEASNSRQVGFDAIRFTPVSTTLSSTSTDRQHGARR